MAEEEGWAMRSAIVCAAFIVAACAEQKDPEQASRNAAERMDAYRAIQKCIESGEDEQSCRRSCDLSAGSFYAHEGCIDGANDLVGATFRRKYGDAQ